MEHHPISAVFVLSFMAAQAPAQIIYTDVIPDALYNVSGDTCHLDLNNDGTGDFDIRYYKAAMGCTGCAGLAHPSWVKIDPLTSNAVAGTQPSQLAFTDLIDAALLWGTGSDQTLSEVYSTHCVSMGGPLVCLPLAGSGEWYGATQVGYLGLRTDNGGTTHYGWAQVKLLGFISSFTLMDYAYNSVPDEFILAGDTGSISTGIAQFAPSSIQVTPNPFYSTLSISISGETTGVVTCTVRALTGEVLVRWTEDGSSGRSSFSRDLTSLASGAYLLEVMIDGDRIVRKVMKE